MLGATEKDVEFAESVGEYGTSSSEKSLIKKEEIRATYYIRQRRLSDIFNEHKIHKVDFVSIDVEGYEFEVLDGIDFEKVDITCFLIENDEGGYPRLKLREYMKNKGYFFAGRIMIDDIFIKK